MPAPLRPCVLALAILIGHRPLPAQSLPPVLDRRIDTLLAGVSTTRLERDLTALVGFGTRHNFSDTLSGARGIGAARRWVRAEFDRISAQCGGCLEVRYQRGMVPAGPRIPRDVEIVNVLAVLRGTVHPDRFVLMTAHLDSRASRSDDSLSDAPGANDDGSGVVAVLEAARRLTARRYGKTIVFAALSGEEHGLWGGRQLATLARDSGWVVEGVLNNDVVGNRRGMNGVPNLREFRVFSEAVPAGENEQDRQARRSRGGDVDGPSRQLARYLDRITTRYVPQADAVMIYRLDRLDRGGDHRPFNDLGFPAVRLTEMHENYHRQHQDVRVEDGIRYGDVLEGVSFPYLARVTRANIASLASLAWAPPPPDSVRMSGAVTPSTTLRWRAVDSPALAGYRIYWRETTAPQWNRWRYVGTVTEYRLENVAIDNYFFGVASVSRDGHESVITFAR